MSVKYSDEAIIYFRDKCLSLAMTNSTPKKYSAKFYEAAEIINQLLRSRNKEV